MTEVKKYKCDICGSVYTDSDKAIACENQCREKKEIESCKEKRYDEIENLVNAYNKDYQSNLVLISCDNLKFSPKDIFWF